ncbi:helix-turn-helix domain-containing protein [Amycolatopsis thermoflava]|uniref:helix-turn-helix domain-containing protein n=1 Tax=Amycolatopsis thermoflava TaxID=84480 RepID=UPI0012F72D86|nr:helix-turn-helix domain-containing protein [Amycolatopsis thermoflava]
MTTPTPKPTVPVGERADRPEPGGPRSPILFTPAQAADRLTVRESWLRRKAGERKIPCTFLGKHLRFSEADLHAIVANGHRIAGPSRRQARRHRGPHSRRNNP